MLTDNIYAVVVVCLCSFTPIIFYTGLRNLPQHSKNIELYWLYACVCVMRIANFFLPYCYFIFVVFSGLHVQYFWAIFFILRSDTLILFESSRNSSISIHCTYTLLCSYTCSFCFISLVNTITPTHKKNLKYFAFILFVYLHCCNFSTEEKMSLKHLYIFILVLL